MTAHTPLPLAMSTPEPQPYLSSEEAANALYSANPEASAETLAGARHDHENAAERAAAEGQAIQARLGITNATDAIERTKKAIASAHLFRSFAAEVLYATPHRVGARIWLLSGMVMIVDILAGVVAAATYLASSGLIDGYSTVAAAALFVFVIAAAMAAGKAFAFHVPARARTYLALGMLATGFLVVTFAFVPIFGGIFNPAAAQGATPSVAAGSLVASTIDATSAKWLVIFHLVGTIFIGSGLGIYIEQRGEAHAKHHVVRDESNEALHALLEQFLAERGVHQERLSHAEGILRRLDHGRALAVASAIQLVGAVRARGNFAAEQARFIAIESMRVPPAIPVPAPPLNPSPATPATFATETV